MFQKKKVTLRMMYTILAKAWKDESKMMIGLRGYGYAILNENNLPVYCIIPFTNVVLT
jgi:hypothetical protein